MTTVTYSSHCSQQSCDGISKPLARHQAVAERVRVQVREHTVLPHVFDIADARTEMVHRAGWNLQHAEGCNACIVLADACVIEEHRRELVSARILARTPPAARRADDDMPGVAPLHMRDRGHQDDRAAAPFGT